MNIYQPILITEQIVNSFAPTRLYIKELAGVKYFGKTTLTDPYSYSGSGTLWQRYIKKYGKENIKTLWVSDIYYDPYELQEIAMQFSIENKIVDSNKWANLINETGLDGGFCGKHTQESKDKISKANTGVVRDTAFRNAVSKVHKGKVESQVTRNKKSIARIGLKHSPETLEKLSKNSGRAIEVMLNGITYRTIREAASCIFPELPYFTGIRKINKMIKP